MAVSIPRSRPLTVLVLVLLGALFGATAFLDSVHHEVRTTRARDHLDHGRERATRDDLVGAVREYRAALSLEREHPEAARALALTLLSLGRLSEAESYLGELLRRDPADGALNRGLARIHAARDRQYEARSSYQRAIYGEWPGDALADRVDTRFELIDYLTRLDAREEILAELLRVKSELPAGQTVAARRVADLLARHGAPELAIDTLDSAATNAPRDVELLGQLAELQMTTGRSADARGTLRRALAVQPSATDLRERLTVIERVLTLDPTLPGLRLVTRTRRARVVLSAVMEQTRACREHAGAPPGLADTRDEAARRLRRPARADAEAAEEELALASRIWSASAACHGSDAEALAIAQVLQRVEALTEPSA